MKVPGSTLKTVLSELSCPYLMCSELFAQIKSMCMIKAPIFRFAISHFYLHMITKDSFIPPREFLHDGYLVFTAGSVIGIPTGMGFAACLWVTNAPGGPYK